MAKPEFTSRTEIYPSIEPEQFKGSLQGKVALVTGSGRGIGKQIAFALARSGASSVAITGRTQSQVDETVKQIQGACPEVKVLGVIADVCQRPDLERLVEEVTESLGPVDILICNAGTNMFMPFHMTDADEWWKQMEINVKAPIELTRMLLPSMQERNTGTIIYTSSRAAGADLPWASGYSCAKTSITRFAGVLQTELNILQKEQAGLGENGISVFSIHPGEIKTDLHQTAYPEKTKKEAPYVIEMMARLHKTHPEYSIDLPAWTCVYLAAGRGDALRGRLVDCTRDLEEVKNYVEAAPKPKITNACG
ncbi:short chain dehydrogenase reductase SDR protein [Rutstroemia sp. NJR-2017a WRK4]|nr:short chain dehydrogenase reductase SDR protein [Rutstroemia sp. NJR-2017a WRK4]